MQSKANKRKSPGVGSTRTGGNSGAKTHCHIDIIADNDTGRNPPNLKTFGNGDISPELAEAYADKRPGKIVCEVCKQRETISLGEQLQRLDATGNILCSRCWGAWVKRQRILRKADVVLGPEKRRVGHIRTARGGPIHWAICDVLHTVYQELLDAGAYEVNDPKLWALILRCYDKMRQASYLTETDRWAMERAG